MVLSPCLACCARLMLGVEAGGGSLLFLLSFHLEKATYTWTLEIFVVFLPFTCIGPWAGVSHPSPSRKRPPLVSDLRDKAFSSFPKIRFPPTTVCPVETCRPFSSCFTLCLHSLAVPEEVAGALWLSPEDSFPPSHDC